MNKQLEDIKAIREMMEKSSKFLSLSGLSGIIAGIAAIAGAIFAYFYLSENTPAEYGHTQKILILLADAIIVLFVSVGAGIYFSNKKAKKNNQKLFNKITQKTLFNLSIPLVAGGIFCLTFLLRGYTEIAISSTLLFYGLALVNASKYTFDEILYLGLTEIVLGLVAVIFAKYGILFWALGFGVCHILYGSIMYVKYDLKKE
jgi:predicted lysophospholipase L1 biosynthesis ABC-type transport system permease subunit